MATIYLWNEVTDLVESVVVDRVPDIDPEVLMQPGVDLYYLGKVVIGLDI